jgi:hypothetical protein
MYRQVTKNPRTGEEAKTIQRLSDNAFVPFDTNNVDYVEYLAWIEAGNTPLPPDEPAE